VTMRVRVENTGQVAGHEVVQVYLQFPAYAGEPSRLLRGFSRTSLLAPGASEDVAFQLSARDLSMWWDWDSRPYCDQRTCYGDSCYSCGERMDWMASPDGGGLSAEQATQQIRSEFPQECARCEAVPSASGSPPPSFLATASNISGAGVATARRAASAEPGNGVVPAGTPRFLGCFADRVQDRDLPVNKNTGDFDYCAQQCQGFKYFGRQWEQECFCGNDYGKYGEAWGCECDAANIGGDKNCVYEAAPPSDSEYVGCFADTVNDRAFEVFAGIGDFNFCASECKAYDYFGRQWEQECWCGNSYDKHGETSGCACNDFNTGGDKNCVYKYKGGGSSTTAASATTTASPNPGSTTATTTVPGGRSDGWHRVDGKFTVFVGGSSRDEQLTGAFEVPVADVFTMPPS